MGSVLSPFMWKTQYSSNIEVISKEENEVRVYVFNTPVGSIKFVEEYLPQTFSWAYTEHFVKTMKI